MTGHLDEPWTYFTYVGVTKTTVYYITCGNRRIATIRDEWKPGDSEAVVKLVLAAPELLTACKASLQDLHDWQIFHADRTGNRIPTTDAVIVQLEAAIAKAEGKDANPATPAS